MEILRKPFQGVFNIIRFNWHFYVLSLIGIAALFVGITYLEAPYSTLALILFLAVTATTLVSLFVSFYVYDCSNLYNLNWLQDSEKKPLHIVNINAGFDETSALLNQKFNPSTLSVFDFYNPLLHTEVSIKRARKTYPPYPNTQTITTDSLPLLANSVDTVFAILAAHEIRNDGERQRFFQELHRILKPNGTIIVTEHLRDIPNFLAYNIGFLHFHSKKSWLQTFANSDLFVKKEIKITPFITTFIIKKNGIKS